jgi:hypothetical protein
LHELYQAYVSYAIEPIRGALINAKKRGIKLRYLTEITRDNISYCKELRIEFGYLSYVLDLQILPLNNKLVDIADCLINGPPANPGDSHTTRVAPIISIIRMAVVILVNTPTIRSTPPMISSSAMDKTNSCESPRPLKTLDLQRYFSIFGNLSQ